MNLKKLTALKLLRLFPLTFFCVALIFVLSFFTPPETPLGEVAFIDKWTHLVMYGGTMSVFWLEYWRRESRGRFRLSRAALVWLTLIVPFVLGGIIELLQAYCTGGRRSGEWADWLADNLGVLIAYALGNSLVKTLVRRMTMW